MTDTHKNDKPNDDVEFTDDTFAADQDTDPIETEARSEDKIKSLQTKLKEAESAKAAAHEEMQRAKADYLNARKRIEDDHTNAQKRATRDFVALLLPLCDSFDVAMQDQAVWDRVDEQWRKGVEGIHSQLQSILDTYNVVREDPTGKTFDPNRHEALTETPVDEPEKINTVTQVIQAGYYIDDEESRLIRPARVAVGVAKSKESPTETE